MKGICHISLKMSYFEDFYVSINGILETNLLMQHLNLMNKEKYFYLISINFVVDFFYKIRSIEIINYYK